jgi:hypothetical protein
MDCSKLNKGELIELCKQYKIKKYSGKNKTELIELIQSNQSKKEDTLNEESTHSGINSNELKAKEVRDNGLDKFYTIPTYSKKCIDTVFSLYDPSSFDLVIEPSAGNGSFFEQIDCLNKIGMDIEPESKNILKMDFFEFESPELNNVLVIGNPPFGKVCSMAIKFFNHSSNWANVIAFIIPRTFRRPSVQNKLNRKFHLIYDEDVPTTPCCFLPQIMVKCCFQIWEKRETERPFIDLPTSHPDWEFLPFGPIDKNGQPTPPTNADFAIRAYGGKIGEIITINLQGLRPKSWHWIKSNVNIEKIINTFNSLDYSDSLNTARQNSMGRGELVRLYTGFINSER